MYGASGARTENNSVKHEKRTSQYICVFKEIVGEIHGAPECRSECTYGVTSLARPSMSSNSSALTFVQYPLVAIHIHAI